MSVFAEQCSKEREREYIALVRDAELREKNHDAYVRAIECLGELCSLPAVSVLIDAIAFRQIFPWQRTPDGVIGRVRLHGTTRIFPAAGALAKIGEASLPMVADAIGRHSEDSTEFRAATYVFQAIFRDDLTLAIDYLEKAAIGAGSEDEKSRILHAAETIRAKMP